MDNVYIAADVLYYEDDDVYAVTKQVKEGYYKETRNECGNSFYANNDGRRH